MRKKLEADLNVVQNAPLDITLLDGDLNIIAKLDDEPNDVGGLTAAELKAKFDQAGNTIKTYLNDTLIPELLAADATEAARSQREQRRQEAELTRTAAEENRAAAETGRTQAEENRALAEELRVRAEENRRSETEGIVAQARREAQIAGINEQNTRRYSLNAEASAAQTAQNAADVRAVSETAKQYAAQAGQAVTDARAAGQAAAESADRSARVILHTPRIRDGCWEVFSGETGTYQSTGVHAQGRDFTLLGYYKTAAALRAAQPNPAPGAAYGVGSAAPYTVLIWDGVGQQWVNNGPIQGPPGKTPVRGTDYWTEGDRRQLVQDTLAALPAWKGGLY